MLNRFRSSGRSKGTNLVVWLLLGLLIVGLTGFGLGGAVGGLATQNIARVGDQPVERETYVRTLLNRINQLAQQTGQRLTMEQARQFGLDQAVLRQMLGDAALDGVADRVGLSVPDTAVRDALTAERGFQGANGGFDRQAYQFFLDRAGLTARAFEADLRAERTRALIERAVAGGAAMPPAAIDALLAFRLEARRFRAVRLAPDYLEQPVGPPAEAELRAQYEATPDAYSRPETRVVAYAALRPQDLADEIAIDPAAVEQAYEARRSEFERPETRIVDAIGFPDMAAARDARARLRSGETTFDALAAARGLNAEDVSLGRVRPGDLPPEARDAVFGTDGPGIAGPVQGDLGPTLYRVNAVLAARTTPLAQVADQLRETLALEQARARISEQYEPVQDLLAAGATLEEVAAETPMRAGEVRLTAAPGDGLAGDPEFRAEAMAAEPGEPRELFQLSGGGIAVLRVERIEPPAVRPLAEVRDRVAEDWRRAEIRRRLTEEARALKARLEEGRTLQAVAGAAGLEISGYGPLRRDAEVPAPLPAGTLEEVFALAPGAAAVLPGEDGGVWLVQLAEVLPPDPQDEATRAARERLSAELSAGLARGIRQGYVQALFDSQGTSVNTQLIDETLAQYP